MVCNMRQLIKTIGYNPSSHSSAKRVHDNDSGIHAALKRVANADYSLSVL